MKKEEKIYCVIVIVVLILVFFGDQIMLHFIPSDPNANNTKNYGMIILML